jgi:hypothetical protein
MAAIWNSQSTGIQSMGRLLVGSLNWDTVNGAVAGWFTQLGYSQWGGCWLVHSTRIQSMGRLLVGSLNWDTVNGAVAGWFTWHSARWSLNPARMALVPHAAPFRLHLIAAPMRGPRLMHAGAPIVFQ